MAARLNLYPAVRDALAEPDPKRKAEAVEQLWRAWQEGKCLRVAMRETEWLTVPGRPERPVLAIPRSMPRRDLSSKEGHGALIHALTHIEFNAINLALDAVYRFREMPDAFCEDWLKVASEEAYHFKLLRQHLASSGYDYGDFSAHGGLWDIAIKTADDPLARMALVPRLMEARGLDVTPGIQKKLRGYGDTDGAAILDIILRDEIGHVAAGDRWFRYLCEQRGLSAEVTFLEVLALKGMPRPRPPFNEAARLKAGFSQEELLALL